MEKSEIKGGGGEGLQRADNLSLGFHHYTEINNKAVLSSCLYIRVQQT